MENCTACHADFHSAVRYCPYCGTAVSAADAAPAPTTAVTEPVAVPLPASEPAPPPVVTDAGPAPTAAPAPAAPLQTERKRTPKPVLTPLGAPAIGPAPVAAAEVATPAATPSQPVAPPKRSRTGLIVGLLVVGAVIVYLKGSPAKTDPACGQAFESGLKSIADGDLAAARNQVTRLSAVCKGDDQSRTKALQAALAKAEASSEDCQRSVRTIRRELGQHDLLSARNAIDGLDSTCAADAKVEPLRQQLGQLQEDAAAARADAAKAIEEQDGAAAKTAIAKLAAIDREHPDLAPLRAELARIAEAKRDASAATSEPRPTAPDAPDLPLGGDQAAPLVWGRPRAPEPVAAPARQPDNGAGMRADMAQNFLREAERALAQRQFDAAKTFVESARRIDPGSSKADSLAQRIRERERQVLQQETTIR